MTDLKDIARPKMLESLVSVFGITNAAPIPGMVALTSESLSRASAMTAAKPLHRNQFVAQTLPMHTYWFKWKSMWLADTS